MRRAGRRGSVRWMASAFMVAVMPACAIQERTIVEVEDVVVAEVYVEVGATAAGGSRVIAFLHRTVGGLGPGFHPVPGARPVIRRGTGETLELGPAELETCAATLPVDGTGSCYWLPPSVAGTLLPGEALELTIELRDGAVLRSATRIPGDFALAGVGPEKTCLLPPDTPWELRWSVAEGAWSYVNETAIYGLPAALAPRGIEVEEDPLELLGLSISAADTAIVFPAEFGVFNRFELDRALALALQGGLPAGTSARIAITAADRNYVNWVRGGNFNPSGQVRVPSIRGGGTGVFAATVTRSVEVWVPGGTTPDSLVSGLPECPVGE